VVWSADLGYAPVDPEVRTLCEAAARRFADFGCTLESRVPGWPTPAPSQDHLRGQRGGQADRPVSRAPDWIEPSLRLMIENAQLVSAIEHSKALVARSAFFDQARRFFETCDLLLTPQMPVAAWGADPGPAGEQGPIQIAGRPTPPCSTACRSPSRST